ncbi:MAG: hypothetical protein QY325_14215 [Flavobacteriales bacterium]|jgi:hypothetical protein|nr:MAG: hypothetical protein QY325_14215 [Flavobacteriales bacterium]
MQRRVLISFLFLLLFQLAAHAQATSDTTCTASVPAPEPTLREALHQVAKGDVPCKGRTLGRWSHTMQAEA